MKKNDNMGFVLAETLIVATIVMAALVFVYSQFQTVNRSYQRTFKYNAVEGLYALDNIKEYLDSDGMSILKMLFNNGTTKYVDITTCPSVYMMYDTYCNELIDVLNIKQVFLTKASWDDVRLFVENSAYFSEEMKLFVNYASDYTNTEYRLWAEFEDGTFATLHV